MIIPLIHSSKASAIQIPFNPKLNGIANIYPAPAPNIHIDISPTHTGNFTSPAPLKQFIITKLKAHPGSNIISISKSFIPNDIIFSLIVKTPNIYLLQLAIIIASNKDTKIAFFKEDIPKL